MLRVIIPRMEGESWSRMLLKFESGTVGTLICQNVAHVAAPADMFRITGTKGELQITSGRWALIIYNDRIRAVKSL